MATYTEFVYSDYFKTELPSHWQEKRLGFLAEQTKNAFVDGPFGSDLKSDDYLDEGVPLIQLNNIRDGKHILRNMKFISDHKKLDLIRHLALPKDIVIAKMAEPVARATIVSDEYDEYVIVADCVKLTPNLNLVDLEFLVWAINSDCVRENAELVSTGTTRIRINLGELKKLKVPYPSLTEQIKIREYLDHETAQIDSLITKQEKLIELLKEKRQAVISHAVTKGLNPDAAMKDSGVEWLGQVPEHWVVSFIKYILAKAKDAMVDGPFGSSVNTATDYVEDGIPVIRTVNITNQGFSSENLKFMRISKFEELKRHSVKTGDVLFSKVGTIGNACIFPENMGVGILSTTGSCKISINEDLIDRDFLVFQIHCMNQELTQIANANVQPFLNMTNIKNLRISLPSLDEQKSIISLLKSKLDSFDRLIAKAESAIQLMQERRTALISAAVTGKIDVRNWQHPNEAKKGLSS